MNLISKLSSTAGESTRLIRNEEKKRFQWIVNVRSEFGDYRADELQVQLASDHIILVGLQQKWRPLTDGQARRSFEARQSLDFPLDERSLCAKETEEGNVCIQATGSGLLQQLLVISNDKSPKKQATVYNVIPFAVPISSTEKLLRTLMGKTELNSSLPEVQNTPAVVSTVPSTSGCLVSSTTSSAVKPTSVVVSKSKRVNVNDLLSSSISKPIAPPLIETTNEVSSPLLSKLLHAVRNKDSVYHQDPEIQELLQCRKRKGTSPTVSN